MSQTKVGRGKSEIYGGKWENSIDMYGKLCINRRGKWGKLSMRCRGNNNSKVAALKRGAQIITFRR